MENKLIDCFNYAIEHDKDLNYSLAKMVMNDEEFYRYLKGENDLLEISLPDFYEEIKKVFSQKYNNQEFDIRKLTETAFGIKIEHFHILKNDSFKISDKITNDINI